MPGRNLARIFVPESYYHLYNRGVNRRKIFLDDADYQYFLQLLARHLADKPTQDRVGREYKWLSPQISLQAYCLMPNHFHLLVYQTSERGTAELMMSVCTAYTMYFNKRYKRRGPLFENSYRASLITDDAYLQHISRYIHLNPANYKQWQYSSYANYIGERYVSWLQPAGIVELSGSVQEYVGFVADYEDVQRSLELIKHELADDIGS